MFRVLPRFPDGVSLHCDLGVQVKLEVIGGVIGGPGGLTGPLDLVMSGPSIMGLGGAQRSQIGNIYSYSCVSRKGKEACVSGIIMLSQWQMDTVCRIDLKLLMSFYPIGV